MAGLGAVATYPAPWVGGHTAASSWVASPGVGRGGTSGADAVVVEGACRTGVVVSAPALGGGAAVVVADAVVAVFAAEFESVSAAESVSVSDSAVGSVSVSAAVAAAAVVAVAAGLVAERHALQAES